MRCDEVWNALNEDEGDLKAVRRHLKRCTECSQRFARDLELEEALRNLDLEVGPIDITAEVGASLSSLDKRRATDHLIRKWIWGTVSLAGLALLILAMPIVAYWLDKAYNLANSLDIGGSIDAAVSSIRFLHLLFLMAAVLACVGAYLWQETRKAGH